MRQKQEKAWRLYEQTTSQIKPWYWGHLKVQVNGAHLTIASIFFLYLRSILLRYSGLINIAAKLKAEFFSPALWHSITAEVKSGTMSVREWNHDVKCLFTTINVESLWANMANKVLMESGVIFSFFMVHHCTMNAIPATTKKIMVSPLAALDSRSSAWQQIVLVTKHIWSALLVSPRSGLHSLKYTFSMCSKSIFTRNHRFHYRHFNTLHFTEPISSLHIILRLHEQLRWVRTDQAAGEEPVPGAVYQWAVPRERQSLLCIYTLSCALQAHSRRMYLPVQWLMNCPVEHSKLIHMVSTYVMGTCWCCWPHV